MRLFGFRQSLLATAALVAASCISCSHRGSNGGQAGPPKNAKPSPEESFNVIVDTFRRRVEDTPVGFVMSDSTGRTSMIGTNKVSSELIRPANETDPYKAIITVVSESRYSIRRSPKESPEDKASDENANAQSDNPLAETGDDKGFESFDPGLVSKPAAEGSKSRTAPLVPSVITPPAPDKQDIRKYELLYQNGRWTLVTELNAKTEQSIQNAFKNALDTQS